MGLVAHFRCGLWGWMANVHSRRGSRACVLCRSHRSPIDRRTTDNGFVSAPHEWRGLLRSGQVAGSREDGGSSTATGLPNPGAARAAPCTCTCTTRKQGSLVYEKCKLQNRREHITSKRAAMPECSWVSHIRQGQLRIQGRSRRATSSEGSSARKVSFWRRSATCLLRRGVERGASPAGEASSRGPFQGQRA